MRADEPLLLCDKLSLGYTEALLPPVTLEIRPGELWAVVGLNGSGKSTWMRTALGLETPLGGRVQRKPGIRLAYVPQQQALDPIYPLRVLDIVEAGTLRPGNLLGLASREVREQSRAALRRVGAEGLEKRPFRDLSGGQRQRVLIARALASGAQLFFFDEPTSALDRQAEAAVLDLIDSIRRAPGCAVALVTHHLQVLRGRADHALLLDRERNLVEVGSAEQVIRSDSFVHLFGELPPVPGGAR